MSRDSIWGAAKRGEGYQLARESNIIWVLVFIGGIVSFTFRYFSGRPLLGDDHRKTDATWNQGGRELLNKKARPPLGWTNPHGFCWERLGEKKRAVIRLGIFVVLIDTFWDIWDHGILFPSITHNLLTLAAIAFVCSSIRIMARRVATDKKVRRTKRELVDPLKTALAPFLGAHSPADVDLNIYPTPEKSS